TVNHAPVFTPPGDQTVGEGSRLRFHAVATDPDGDRLTFRLDPGAPAGAAIDPATGVFTWTPGDGPARAAVRIRVTDDGVPAQSAVQTVSITVNNVAPRVDAGRDAH